MGIIEGMLRDISMIREWRGSRTVYPEVRVVEGLAQRNRLADAEWRGIVVHVQGNHRVEIRARKSFLASEDRTYKLNESYT